MSKTDSTIQLRIDLKTKEQASETFEKMGLDLSSAIKLFLTQAIMTQSIPFQIITENGYTPEYEESILREMKSTKGDKKFNTVKELMADLEND